MAARAERKSGLEWPGWFSDAGFGANWLSVPALEGQVVRSTHPSGPTADESSTPSLHTVQGEGADTPADSPEAEPTRRAS